MYLDSVPLWPQSFSANGIPTNFVLNQTPDGQFQVARVLLSGGPKEGDFEILFSSQSREECMSFLREQVEKDFPGLR